MIPVRRLNHAVLYVRDARRSAEFYRDVLGFETVSDHRDAVFLRVGGGDNHHDLGLFSVGLRAPGPQRGSVGLYHLAWEVDSIEALAAARETLVRHHAYVGESDHGVSKSLYGHDPDGIEFEIMFAVPRAAWGDAEHDAVIAPLHLDAELERWASR